MNLDELIDFYDSKDFNKFTYNGELGAKYTKEKTIFKVWSPISTNMVVRIYETGTPKELNGSNEYNEYQMEIDNYGVWTCQIDLDLEGKYYTYVVTNAIYIDKEVVDPYAKTTGINGLRGMIVDFSITNPEGWEDIYPLNIPKDNLVVYEAHVADISSSDSWNGSYQNKRLFGGMYEKGTKYQGLSTGFDNIVDLGVNTVQILPFFDQENDERPDVNRTDNTKREFNWGYNPQNYNSIDGIYSKNPYDGYQRIVELKELVMAFNKKGINVIMDVVYNHMNDLGKSSFNSLMPGYYFRYKNYKISDGSACGNETASERPMFKKFMVDSTEFWATEYKLGGFRFDLMGIHNVETMNELTANLKAKLGSYITVYGEPWAAGEIALKDGYIQAVQIEMEKYEGYGCFNDKIRDALIKGGLNEDTDLGWITSTSLPDQKDVGELINGINGKILENDSNPDSEKCVNYATCHDNYTLYDRIKAAGIKDEATVKKMAMLANSVVLTTKGIAFMLSGEEFLRTKGGNPNSYNSSYEVNELNYALKASNLDMYTNYQKLIKLKTYGLFNKNVKVKTNTSKSLLYFNTIDEKNSLEYIIVHSNGYKANDKAINLEGYTIYLDTLNSNIELTNNTKIQEYQTIIAYKNI